MSIFNAMYNGVSGMNAQSRSLTTISQNIANVNTVGYKGARTSFETLVGGWTGAGSVSGGVRASAQSLISQQGQLQSTGSTTDLAIDGDGFFVVSGGSDGDIMFTRAGAFSLNANNTLVNTASDTLMGWRLDDAGRPIGSSPTSTAGLQPINLSGVGYAAQATSTASIAANLSADMPVGADYGSSIQVYDSLGVQHSLALDWEKMEMADVSGALDATNPPGATALTVAKPDGTTTTLTLNFAANGAGGWTLTPAATGGTVTTGSMALAFDGTGALTGDTLRELTVDWGNGATSRVGLDMAALTSGTGTVTAALDENSAYRMTVGTGNSADTVSKGGSAYVTFDADGRLVSPATQEIAIDWADSVNNAADAAITLSLGTPGQTDGLTSMGGTSTVRGTQQNGLAVGTFTGVTVDKTGKVIAQFDNGQSRAIYQVPVAQFANADGLEAISGNAYRQTVDSGAFVLGASGTGGAGEINGSSLEGSTVDLAGEFSSMIITQRAYSANATVITTADEMLKTLDQLKR